MANAVIYARYSDGRQREESIEDQAVSYTHLDVYKRQVLLVDGVGRRDRIIGVDERGEQIVFGAGQVETVHTHNNHPSDAWTDRKSTRLNSSHITRSRMPSSACNLAAGGPI